MNHKTEYIWTCKIGGPATQRHPLDVEALYELQKVMADFGGDWPDVPGEQEVVRRAKMLSRLWKADRAALAAQPGAVGKIPTVCDGKEQEAFEKWAAHNRFNLSEHPLHYLFLDPKTDAARQAWKGALEYVGRVLAAAPQVEGWVMVPVDVLKAASESLGSFVSDHGWGDADMQAMDNLDAYLAARPSAPTAAKPDCSGGIACTTCPDKHKCQRGCIRQGEVLENPNRKDLRAECDAVDALLRGLGLDPERCRTEGGALNARRALSLLADGVKAKPVAWGMRWQGHGPIMDCITPEEHESHEGEYTVPLFATPPTEAKPAQADALNTLCKMLHSGEEVEGDDGLAMLVPMDLWNEAQEAIELLVVEDEAIEAKPAQDAVDAERYRLLRRGQHWSVIDGIGNVLRGDDLDAAINAKKVGAA